jgi:hypothetical protein
MMKKKNAFPHLAIAVCIASAMSSAHAANSDYTGQSIDFIPSADQSSMILKWTLATDDFGPRQPCNLKQYSLYLFNDNTFVQSYDEQTSPLLADSSGNCFFQKTITSGAVYSSKVSPGIWTADAYNPVGGWISDNETIFACTATQGKQAMYWTRNSAYTDNFYTTSASDRNASLNAGYSNRGVPFSMPGRVRYGSASFYRYYKGAPQFEHFYTYSTPEWQFVEQNGYTYEGVEGFVFKDPKPGTVALRRYALFNGATGDLQHYYTITQNDPAASGWGYDGIVGHVCTP